MEDNDLKKLRVGVLIDEYKELGSEVRLRIDLQHKNMNVLLVLVTAVSGYLIKYASDHGFSGPGSLPSNELLALLPLVAVVINVFLWRHLDHDMNILDKAAYQHKRLRPLLEEDLGGDVPLLGFEEFLNDRRAIRVDKGGLTANFGKEDVPMFVLLATALGASWYCRFEVHTRAGEALHLFDGLLYTATVAAVLSFTMAVKVGNEYRALGADEDDQTPALRASDAEPSTAEAVPPQLEAPNATVD